MSNELSSVELVTPECRLAFPALFTPKPRSKRNPDKLSYQAVLLIPADTDLSPFKKAVIAAMERKWGKAIKLTGHKNPIHDCEEKDFAGYEDGWHFINTHNDIQPAVVNHRKVPIADPNEVYPGCWVKAFINAYTWDHEEGGKGVSFGLNAIQKVRDDDRFDGRVVRDDAAGAFEPIGGDDIDEASDDAFDPFT